METSWQFRDGDLIWHDCSKDDAIMASSHGHDIRPEPDNYMAEIKRDYLEKEKTDKESTPNPSTIGSQSNFQEEYQIQLDWLDSQKN